MLVINTDFQVDRALYKSYYNDTIYSVILSKDLKERIIEKTLIPKDITPEEFVNFCKSFGVTCIPGRGSHYKISFIGKDNKTHCWTIPLGHNRNIKAASIREFRKIWVEFKEEDK